MKLHFRWCSCTLEDPYIILSQRGGQLKIHWQYVREVRLAIQEYSLHELQDLPRQRKVEIYKLGTNFIGRFIQDQNSAVMVELTNLHFNTIFPLTHSDVLRLTSLMAHFEKERDRHYLTKV